MREEDKGERARDTWRAQDAADPTLPSPGGDGEPAPEVGSYGAEHTGLVTPRCA